MMVNGDGNEDGIRMVMEMMTMRMTMTMMMMLLLLVMMIPDDDEKGGYAFWHLLPCLARNNAPNCFTRFCFRTVSLGVK